MPDHVHMLLSIPPKFAVSQVVGFIKGKSAIHMARVYGERKRNFVAAFLGPGILRQHGRRDEEAIRAYIRNQEKEDQRLEQMNLWRYKPPLGGSKFQGPRQRPLLPLRAAPDPKPPQLPGDTYPFQRLTPQFGNRGNCQGGVSSKSHYRAEKGLVGLIFSVWRATN